MLHALDTDLWTAAAPFRVAGLHIGTRTSVARLPDGGLWVHSPLRWEPAWRDALEPLGPVRFLVAPNLVHHLFLREWSEAFPEARLFGAVGLPDKRRDLRFHGVLADHPDPAWQEVLDQALLYGVPRTNEVAFLHRPSGTLILTDLAFHIVGPVPWSTRLYLRIGRCHGRLACTAIMRAAIRDRNALRASLERVLAWDFDRISVCHGEVVERDAKRALSDAFAWL